MCRDSPHTGPTHHIPHPNTLIKRPGGQDIPRGVESQTKDVISVALEGVFEGFGGEGPEGYGPIIGGCGEVGGVG